MEPRTDTDEVTHHHHHSPSFSSSTTIPLRRRPSRNSRSRGHSSPQVDESSDIDDADLSLTDGEEGGNSVFESEAELDRTHSYDASASDAPSPARPLPPQASQGSSQSEIPIISNVPSLGGKQSVDVVRVVRAHKILQRDLAERQRTTAPGLFNVYFTQMVVLSVMMLAAAIVVRLCLHNK